MGISWECFALSFVPMWLASPATAQTATAGVTAELVSPSQVQELAADWLMSKSPGVFMLRIPGVAHAPATAVTVHVSTSGSGTIDLFGSMEGAEGLRQFLALLASSAEAGSGAIYQLSSATAYETMGTHGVQLILTTPEVNGSGDGVVIATIAFD